jgi:phospholipid-binding lipoprotein MlaA
MLLRILLAVMTFLPVNLIAQDYADPWEPYNRGIFSFNEAFDRTISGPVARGYNKALPKPVRKGVTNFFDNLRYPQYLVADLLQFKFSKAVKHTGRFLLNTTVGLAGFIDVAESVGLEAPYKEDFGRVFETWGIGSGPYWVLPFLGPSTLRNGIGYMFDVALYPPFWLGFSDKIDSRDALVISSSATALNFIESRAALDEGIETGRKSSLDFYSFTRSSYYQYRRNLSYDGFPPDEEEEFLDEETEELTE